MKGDRLEAGKQLVERYLDDALDAEEMAVLDDLLRTDAQMRQVFRARVRLHGLLARHFEWVDAQADVPPLMPVALKGGEPATAKNGFRLLLQVAAMVALLLAGGFWLRSTVSRNVPQWAMVSASMGARWSDGSIVGPGDLLGDDWYSLEHGVIEIVSGQGVSVAIEAPARFRWESVDRIRLEMGELSAQVPDGAEGFTVVTREGNVIDLGTRFGVSVQEKGVNAHVFDGEVEVARKGKSAVYLATSEAMDLSENIREIADEESFPMPSYVLDAALVDPGFETVGASVDGLPRVAGRWGGDLHEMVGSSGGIVPMEGQSMLQFRGTHRAGEAARGQVASELWQLVDLSEESDAVNRGGVSARVVAHFNRITGGDAIDRRFGLALTAFRGSLGYAPVLWDERQSSRTDQLARSVTYLQSDDDPASWEQLDCTLPVPPGTDYLVVQLFAYEDTANDTVDEFPGHFADGATLTITAAARSARAVARWGDEGGVWRNPSLWREGRVPDGNLAEVRLGGPGQVVIERKVSLMQDLVISGPAGNPARLRISPEATLERFGVGELLVGYNVGEEAELIVEGELMTRENVFIGRNNLRSRVVIDGGRWISYRGLVRMAQYGSRGPDTQSELIVQRGGEARLERLEMVHDDSRVRVTGKGRLVVDRLLLGGGNGTARVEVADGVVRIGDISFGEGPSVIALTHPDGMVELAGAWSEEALRSLPGAQWECPGGMEVEEMNLDGARWTRIRNRLGLGSLSAGPQSAY